MNQDPVRDVQVASIGAETWVLRSRSWDRLKFEVEYARQKGTTSNAYLIQARQSLLIDPPGASFTERFLQTLPDYQYLQRLDLILLSHVNPNRIATLKPLLAAAPYAKLICSRPAAIALRAALESLDQKEDPRSAHPEDAAELGIPSSVGPHELVVIRQEAHLDLGEGHELQIRFVPTPRHPDALCTFDPATGILFSDKLFGCHVCDEWVLDAHWRSLAEDRRYYFDCLHSSQGSQVKASLDKLDPWPATTYAPAHGPVVRHSVSRLRLDYQHWCEAQKSGDLRVAVLYASAYGNTSTMAAAISQGLEQAGATVDLINCEQASPITLTQTLAQADGVIIGSPTLAGHAPIQIQTALGIVLSTVPSTKLVGVFGSYGWSGEAVDQIEAKLRDAGHSFGFEPLRVKFKPTPERVQQCQQAGSGFAQSLRKQLKTKQLQVASRQTATAAPTDRTGQALDRVIGSVCVITSGPQDVGILTQSVSQASFIPPGITLSLPKSSALAHLAQPDAPFVVNILAESDPLPRLGSRPLGRAGILTADDLQSLDPQPAENGCWVLPMALAHLVCRVQSWIEAGDHWILYAHVGSGKVQQQGLTAVGSLRRNSSSLVP